MILFQILISRKLNAIRVRVPKFTLSSRALAFQTFAWEVQLGKMALVQGLICAAKYWGKDTKEL
jgi:hypothetical protein